MSSYSCLWGACHTPSDVRYLPGGFAIRCISKGGKSIYCRKHRHKCVLYGLDVISSGGESKLSETREQTCNNFSARRTKLYNSAFGYLCYVVVQTAEQRNAMLKNMDTKLLCVCGICQRSGYGKYKSSG
jgi:hypothetical protein